jgi:hypothetical protein
MVKAKSFRTTGAQPHRRHIECSDSKGTKLQDSTSGVLFSYKGLGMNVCPWAHLYEYIQFLLLYHVLDKNRLHQIIHSYLSLVPWFLRHCGILWH